jgi:chemotaxis protein MotD
LPQALPQVSQIAPAAADTRPATQRKGGGFADLLDTMDARRPDQDTPQARDTDDAEPVKTRRRADHAGRQLETRHKTRNERRDGKADTATADTSKTDTKIDTKTDADRVEDVSAAGKPKEDQGKDTQDSADAAIDPQPVENAPTPDMQTGMIEAAVAPAPAPVETSGAPVLAADTPAEIEAPQQAAPQAPEADAAPDGKKAADAAQTLDIQASKKSEPAPPQTKDAASAADTKPAPQAAKDVAALNPPVDDKAKAVEPVAKPEQPALPDASVMRADTDGKSASESRAAKQPETLENALAKQFGTETKSADPAPVTLSDAARAAQNNFTPASVTLQTSASAATNQPVPLQAAALAIEIASRAKDGMREFQIRLDPPELGRVDVKLNVDRHGQVNTHLTVDRPETLDLLRRDAHSLERALQQSGLKTSDGNLEFSLRQQTPDGFNQRQAQSQQGGDANGAPATEADAASSVHAEYQWAARLRGGVDIRV